MEDNRYIVGSRTKMINDIKNLEDVLCIIPMHRETEKIDESWTDEALAKYRWLLQDWKSREGGNGT